MAVGHHPAEMPVDQQVAQMGVAGKGLADVLQQARADDAAGAPDGGDLAKIQLPLVLQVTGPEQRKNLGVRAYLGCQQGAADLVLHGARVANGLRRRPGEQCGGPYPLGLKRAHGARKHGIGNGRRSHPQVERQLTGPFAGAFLFGGVEDHVYQRATGVGIGMREDVGGDADQVARQFTLVPRSERLAHLGRRHAQQLLHQAVGLADHLHVGVLDAVVDHLDEVACAAMPHPFAAGQAVIGFGRNRLQHGAHQRPGLDGSSRHQRRPAQRAFLPAADASADVKNAGFRQRAEAAVRVGVQGVAAVDEHIARVQQRAQVGQHRIDGPACRHHHQDAARSRKAGGHLGQRGHGPGPKTVGAQAETLALARVQVKAAHGKAVALQVQGQVFPHHAQADEADVCLLHRIHFEVAVCPLPVPAPVSGRGFSYSAPARWYLPPVWLWRWLFGARPIGRMDV